MTTLKLVIVSSILTLNLTAEAWIDSKGTEWKVLSLKKMSQLEAQQLCERNGYLLPKVSYLRSDAFIREYFAQSNADSEFKTVFWTGTQNKYFGIKPDGDFVIGEDFRIPCDYEFKVACARGPQHLPDVQPPCLLPPSAIPHPLPPTPPVSDFAYRFQRIVAGMNTSITNFPYCTAMLFAEKDGVILPVDMHAYSRDDSQPAILSYALTQYEVRGLKVKSQDALTAVDGYAVVNETKRQGVAILCR